jgi:hypothetical protein
MNKIVKDDLNKMLGWTWMGRQSGWRRLAGSTLWSLEQHLIIELLNPLQYRKNL